MEDRSTLIKFLIDRCYGFRLYCVDQGPIEWDVAKVVESSIDRYTYVSTHAGRLLKWMTVKFQHFIGHRKTMSEVELEIKNRLLVNGIALPNFVVINSFNHTAELWYGLKTPVRITGSDKESRSSLYCKQIYTTIKERLNSKSNSVLSHSMSPWWTNHDTIDFHNQGMTLDEIRPSGELAKHAEMYLDVGDYLFHRGRKWAYSRVNAELKGAVFNEPLDLGLLRYLTSLDMTGFIHYDNITDECIRITQYIARYIESDYRPKRTAYLQQQSERGSLKGQVFRDEKQPLVYQLLDEGKTPKEIERLTGVKRDTVGKWKKARKLTTQQPRGL